MKITNPDNPNEVITGKEIIQTIIVLAIAGYCLYMFISVNFIHNNNTAYIGDVLAAIGGIFITFLIIFYPIHRFIFRANKHDPVERQLLTFYSTLGIFPALFSALAILGSVRNFDIGTWYSSLIFIILFAVFGVGLYRTIKSLVSYDTEHKDVIHKIRRDNLLSKHQQDLKNFDIETK